MRSGLFHIPNSAQYVVMANWLKTRQTFFQRAIRRTIEPEEAARKQRQIREHLLLNSARLKAENFSVISPSDLGMLFQLTDEVFFEGELASFVEANFRKPLTFRLSTRMTKAGGTTTMFRSGLNRKDTEFEIAIATTPLFSSFGGEPANVGGVPCYSRLEALQRIMEHEIIHLVELLGTGDSNCQARPFRSLVRSYFGHLESNHQLLTPADLARKKLGIRCGDTVVFQVAGKNRRGVVNRITKRATVLVQDPSGDEYCDGVCYAKYYVPLPALKRA